MSRNFELLQQAGKTEQVLPPTPRPVSSRNGTEERLDLDALALEEAIKLVQRVFLLPGASAPRAVVVSAIETGDGASWVCTHAGEILASQITGAVCVVDANLRSPSLHHYFGLENSVGLTDSMLHEGSIREFAQRLAGGNLWVITSGPRSVDPRAVLTSDGLRSRVAELKNEFEYVLIDAPPLSRYSDSLLLGKLADGVVLVVQANSTHRETTRKAKESLESANIPIWGAVLNKRTFPIPDSLYRRI